MRKEISTIAIAMIILIMAIFAGSWLWFILATEQESIEKAFYSMAAAGLMLLAAIITYGIINMNNDDNDNDTTTGLRRYGPVILLAIMAAMTSCSNTEQPAQSNNEKRVYVSEMRGDTMVLKITSRNGKLLYDDILDNVKDGYKVANVTSRLTSTAPNAPIIATVTCVVNSQIEEYTDLRQFHSRVDDYYITYTARVTRPIYWNSMDPIDLIDEVKNSALVDAWMIYNSMGLPIADGTGQLRKRSSVKFYDEEVEEVWAKKNNVPLGH